MERTRLRVGRKVGRTIYEQLGDEPSDRDPLVGVMDTIGLAEQVVTADRELAEVRAENERLMTFWEPCKDCGGTGDVPRTGDYTQPPDPCQSCHDRWSYRREVEGLEAHVTALTAIGEELAVAVWRWRDPDYDSPGSIVTESDLAGRVTEIADAFRAVASETSKEGAT